MENTLHRLWKECPIAYLRRMKKLYHPRNKDHKVYLPEINKAFTQYLGSHPAKSEFEGVMNGMVITSSMLWDIMHYREWGYLIYKG